jgi:hypothetical protein
MASIDDIPWLATNKRSTSMGNRNRAVDDKLNLSSSKKCLPRVEQVEIKDFYEAKGT